MIRKFESGDLPQMIDIWNEIVTDGDSFPQKEKLTLKSSEQFFFGQSFTGVLEMDNKITGLYILHPNNVGRCGHIANASYAVKKGERGKKIGEKLILHSIVTAREMNFRILQFNAVTVTNTGALHLYRKLGFIQLGIIPGGFCNKTDEYIDIIPHYIELK